MLKPKFSYHPVRKVIIFLILIFISIPLYTFELSEPDNSYFHVLTGIELNDREVKENLTKSAMYGSKSIRLAAALKLAELELKQKNYKSVSNICISLLDFGYTEIDLLENLLDSYYLQKDYKSLILAVNKYIQKDTRSTSSGITLKSSPKIEYYSFIAKLYDGSEFPQDHFRDLLIGNPASKLIKDAYSQARELGISLPVTTNYLAKFKIELFNREYYSAGRTMFQILKIQKDTITATLNNGFIIDNVILSPTILDEMYKTANASGRRREFLVSIEELLLIPENTGYEPGEVYSYELIAGLYETAGYLKRISGSYSSAADMFMASLPYVSGRKYEKMLWYWYNCLTRYSPDTAAGQISLLADKWSDPDYFADVLSELASHFVQQGQWGVIKKILDVIEFSGPDESISRYAYITARAGLESYISISTKEITRLMTLSYTSGFGIASGLYYRILAGNYLKVFDIRQLPWIFNMTVSRIPVPKSTGMDGSSELVFGLLECEHYVDAYNYLMDNPFSDFSLVRRTALDLSDNKHYAKSIRLLNYYSLMDEFNLNIADLKLVYPDAYNEKILEIAEKEALEWYVFTALVREESHFQPRVISSAGAIGLSQLMPTTAADVAQRLRLRSYNLKDASVNLMFGGWYLGNMKNRTDILSDALFAYNGGLTRVRRWRAEYSSLPDDLFLEAIPYKETSHYGRKLLVSSVIYGYLYEGIQPNKIVSLFYRN